MVRAFIFSLDIIFSMAVLLIFLAMLATYMNSIPFSRLADYERFRYVETGMQSLKANGTLESAITTALGGQSGLARTRLSQAMRDAYGNRGTQAIQIDVYNASMSLTTSLRATNPQGNRQPGPYDNVVVSSRTYVYPGYYALVRAYGW